MPEAISNTSPLLNLYQSGGLTWLPQLLMRFAHLMPSSMNYWLGKKLGMMFLTIENIAGSKSKSKIYAFRMPGARLG